MNKERKKRKTPPRGHQMSAAETRKNSIYTYMQSCHKFFLCHKPVCHPRFNKKTRHELEFQIILLITIKS